MFVQTLPPPDSEVARLFGLEVLRRGRCPWRDKSDEEAPFILSIWRAQILPSFDPTAHLTVITCADRYPGLVARCQRFVGRSPSIRWRKALLWLEGEAAIIELPRDPVPAALRRICLFEPYNRGALDGVSYKLDVDTSSAQVRLEFSNPEIRSLRRLENALWAVAREAARDSDSELITRFWKKPKA